MNGPKTYTAFAGGRVVASGDLKRMLLGTKKCLDRGEAEGLLIFEDWTGRQVDFDFRGVPEEVLRRADPPSRNGPGRPKLGVVSREVTLLPRHWQWLEQQPNGISAALRRLADEARKRNPGEEDARLAREAASRFMTAMAGNLVGFEEASRALFARDRRHFNDLVSAWPDSIRDHLAKLARPAFARRVH
jgi:uncharacterized protein